MDGGNATIIAAVIAAAIAVTGMALFIRKKKKQK